MHRNAFTKSVVAVTLLSLTACPSTTLIRTVPSGAKLYLDGGYVGRTPYTMTDVKLTGSVTTIRLEKPGYEPVDATITRTEEFDVGACITGMFFLAPFLWVLGYQPVHSYQLQPKPDESSPPSDQL